MPINRLGLTMGYGELAGLLALVGRAVTLEILLEGRVFGADEALSKGLVNRVVPDDKVEDEAYALARRIAEGAPLVARWHKQFIERLTRDCAALRTTNGTRALPASTPRTTGKACSLPGEAQTRVQGQIESMFLKRLFSGVSALRRR